MRELSVAEQRDQAVLSVIKDGRTVTETAAVGVSRQTLHAWLAKYEAESPPLAQPDRPGLYHQARRDRRGRRRVPANRGTLRRRH
jgi:hypothetical protein